MRMILEVFYVRPPTYHREILLRVEGGNLNYLVALGDSRQNDLESIHYHILFEGMPPRREGEEYAVVQ
mgnify:FL=1